MKLTKKLEKEIMHVHEAYWDSYLKGDVATMTTLLDEDYTQVGSAEGEVFSNKKDAVQFLQDTIDQIAGKLEMRNRVTKIELEPKTGSPIGDTPCLVSDRSDIYVLSDGEWIFYSKFRASTLLQKRGKEWKIIHQHSSFPDTRAEEGQNIATEKIAQENLQLREAVKRRTIELEQKSRELEIETSLERVRAMALSMRKPEDLPGICEVLFIELNQLGFSEIRNAMINIHDDDKGTFINYDYSDEIGKSINHLHYNIHPLIEKQIKQIRSAGDAFSETSFTGKDLKEWKKFRKKIGEKDDPRIENIDALYYYFYSIGTGSIGISTFNSITDDKVKVLKRFRNVFEFAYRRYMDVAQADAQAREAQIELGLERVRARAMAMQNSDELAELVSTVFKELTHLDFALTSCILWINNTALSTEELWVSSPGINKPAQPYYLKPFKHSFFKSIVHAWKEKDPKWIFTLSGSEKDSFQQAFFDDVAELPDVLKAALSVPEKVVFSASFNHFGALEIVGTEALTDDKFDILHRFGKVFDLTYTRFNDLKQAEAQAKEAQIEVALERVRARAMAMHASSELIDVANVLRDQMGLLGQHQIETMAIHLYYDHEETFDSWYAGRDQSGKLVSGTTQFKKDSCWLLREALAGYHSHQQEYDIEVGGEQLKEWLNVLVAAAPEYDIMLKDFPERSYYHITDFSGGSMIMVAYQPPSDETKALQKRCTKVFDLAYRRFVDIKQAEAQAKEAQIELALERVRARTMAMHDSSELAETAQVLFQQFAEMGGIPDRIAICLVDETNEMVNFWTTDQSGGQITKSFQGRLNESTTLSKAYAAWKNQDKFLLVDLTGKELRDWIRFVREEMGIVIKDDFFKNRRVHQIAIFSHGWIMISTHEPLSSETTNILERFASVFNLTFRRFLDLQKAEAQAREAKIEAALERVRSRTMAMQKSEDLNKAASDMFKQIQLLGMRPWACGFNIFERDEKAVTQYMSVADGGISPPFRTPLTEDPFFINIYEARQRRDDLLVMESSGKGLEETYRYMFGLPGSGEIFGDLENSGFEMPKFQITHCAYFSQGYLVFITYEHVTEAHDIFKRFAIVFEQTYTRFLDLQKAEAQAKEAKIEAALEKVRSRSLAMHKSEELQEVVTTVFERLQDLDIQTDAINLDVFAENKKDAYLWTAVPGHKYSKEIHIPYNETTIFKDIYDGMIRGKEMHSKVYSRELKDEFLNYVFEHTDFRYMPEERKEMLFNTNGSTVSVAYAKNTAIIAQRYRKDAFSDDDNEILKRFARVFEQAYTRFLDLQKAEAQAREAQIQLALERIRARTMAMQHSDELQDTAILLFQQMKALGVQTGSCGFNIWEKDEKTTTVWMSSAEGGFQTPFKMPHTVSPIYKLVHTAMKNGEDFLVKEVSAQELVNHFDYLLTLPGIGDVIKNLMETGYQFPETIVYHFAFFNNGYLAFHLHEQYPEVHDIFKRFAKVFEQTYTRFLDLQKAEAQVREAQIETALEKVRSKTMAMHKSEEVTGIAVSLNEELVKLGFEGGSTIIIIDRETGDTEQWTGFSENKTLKSCYVPYFKHPFHDALMDAWKKGEKFLVHTLAGKEKKIFDEHYFATGYKDFPESDKQWMREMRSVTFSYAFMKYGAIHWGPDLLSDEQLKILQRFSKVFEQSYTRFLDLQKAEAQAREAQIETALERVRSRAMGMQKSEELKEVIQVVYDQFVHLNIHVEHSGFIMDYKERKDMHIWLADKHAVPFQVTIPYFDCAHWNSFNEAKEKGIDFFANKLSFEEKNKFYQDLFKLIPGVPEETKEYYFSCPGLAISTVLLENVGLYIENFSGTSYSDEENNTLMRFGKVFQQTYTRFLDLQKAEAQAREATIEAALERVRGKAMAMHSSKDLATTIGVFYHELEGLNLTPRRCGVGLLNKESWMAEISTMNATADGQGVELIGVLDMRKHPVLTGVYNNWLTHTEYHSVLRGNEIKEYYEVVRPQMTFQDFPNDTVQYGYHFFFEEGGVYAWTEKELNEDELKIYRRFTSVLSLTYKRYKDLRDAETRAQIAIKDAALDRIRADIASMRTIEDLDRITPLIWNELTVLGIPFIRCGVFIMDDEQQIIHTFLSTPDGKAIAAYHLPYDTPGNIKHVLSHWKQNKNYIDHWDETEFIQFADILVKQGALASNEQYLKTLPKGGFYLHFLPFLQGMLYVGNTTQLNNDEIELIQHIADAFSTAYARYEDFNKLEAANNKIEKTLVDLKQTQSQLVQSEKMASLGELTAGIAHEIQNPLNFVNNFSEVNKEILEEMKEELAIGNKQLATGNSQEAKIKIEQAIAIANDVIDNSEKINHHGKRAESIVKGMLQHSRKSTGIKEPTDINALADEYMRLSYHGLRAKDKSLSAGQAGLNAVPIAIGIKMDLDPTLPLVKVIPQDIGRVLLNLFNNAFWAVNERQQDLNKRNTADRIQSDNNQALGAPEFVSNSGVRGKTENEYPFPPPAPKGEQNFVYQPIVSLSTKNLTDHIEIRIHDNGPGIPPHIIDKIFQPFFTTKPTGQGTGLGLSLAYDIIKAHSGELRVITDVEKARLPTGTGSDGNENVRQGSEFIIQLPIS